MGHHKGSARRKEEEEFKVGRKVVQEVKPQAEETVKEVKTGRKRVEQRLITLKQATTGAWNELRTGFQKATAVFQAALQEQK